MMMMQQQGHVVCKFVLTLCFAPLYHYTIIIMTTLPAEVQRTLSSGNGKGGGGGGITESLSGDQCPMQFSLDSYTILVKYNKTAAKIPGCSTSSKTSIVVSCFNCDVVQYSMCWCGFDEFYAGICIEIFWVFTWC